MKFLIIGSGGREHALAWKIARSPKVKKVYCAPGNGGMAGCAECVDIPVSDTGALLKFAKEQKIDLTVVGPEAPLVAGIVDVFRKDGLNIFGPTAMAAQLEGSKIFAKEFMLRRNIPTAPFKVFTDAGEAMGFAREAAYPLVVKADGLAAGKGVVICKTHDEAREAIDQIMNQKVFADAGARLLIEECLEGEEASILAVSDGENFVILDSSQDHKRIFDDDMGPNTGGMGAYSPAPVIDEAMLKIISARVIEPTIRGMARENNPFTGVLYAGLMITKEGPQVLEYNVRFGDPEAQAVLPRLKTDLADVLLSACDGTLKDMPLQWDERACVCVVMSSGGYPGDYETGKEITGLDSVPPTADQVVFHAGTKISKDKIVTSGGRVLGVTGLGLGIEDAIRQAYAAVEKITFDHCFFRRDIGAKALRRMGNKSRIASKL